MAVVRAEQVELCECGEVVAMVRSAQGRLYPVEIKEDQIGKEPLFVASNDFHYCAYYAGLAHFLNSAISRSAAARLRIRLLTAKNEHVMIAWSGKRFANVTDGRPYESSTYYGSVSLDNGGFRMAAAAPEGLLDLLAALDKHPAAAARAYGEATGQCCFCDRPLDDERSIVVGYGSTCAAKYGLPWGNEGENTTRRATRTRKAVRLEDEE